MKRNKWGKLGRIVVVGSLLLSLLVPIPAVQASNETERIYLEDVTNQNKDAVMKWSARPSGGEIEQGKTLFSEATYGQMKYMYVNDYGTVVPGENGLDYTESVITLEPKNDAHVFSFNDINLGISTAGELHDFSFKIVSYSEKQKRETQEVQCIPTEGKSLQCARPGQQMDNPANTYQLKNTDYLDLYMLSLTELMQSRDPMYYGATQNIKKMEIWIKKNVVVNTTSKEIKSNGIYLYNWIPPKVFKPEITAIDIEGSVKNFVFDRAVTAYPNVIVPYATDVLRLNITGKGRVLINGSELPSSFFRLTSGVAQSFVIEAEGGEPYTLNVTRNLPAIAAPTASVPSGSVMKGETVSLTASDGASIYYTMDGSEPTEQSTLYTGPISLTSDVTLKAIAVKAGHDNSAVSSASYTVKEMSVGLTGLAISAATLSFAPMTDTYNVTVASNVASVQVTPTGPGQISIDGVMAMSGVSSQPISLVAGATKKITIVAQETNKLPRQYVVNVTRLKDKLANPTFSKASGAVLKDEVITISAPKAEAIYYTTDGTLPSVTNGTKAVGDKVDVTIQPPMTVKAMALHPDAYDSDVTSASYTQAVTDDLTNLQFNAVVNGLTFSPNRYAYNDLTVDHDTALLQVNAAGEGTISINNQVGASRAIALTPGVPQTIDIKVEEPRKTPKFYTVTVTRAMIPQAPPTITPSGDVLMDEEITIQSPNADAIYYTTNGTPPSVTNGTKAVGETVNVTVKPPMTVKAIAVRDHYYASDVATASYTQTKASDLTSLQIGANSTGFSFSGNQYDYPSIAVDYETALLPITASGTGTITINDKAAPTQTVALTPGVPTPITVKVEEAKKATKVYTLVVTRAMTKQAKPLFNVTDSAVPMNTKVTIQSPDATAIYYTLDGTTPSPTNGEKATTPVEVTIQPPMTIKAIAVRDHYYASDVSEQHYEQAVSAPLSSMTLDSATSDFNFTPTELRYDNVTVAHETEAIRFKFAEPVRIGTEDVAVGQWSQPIALTPGVAKQVAITHTEEGKLPRTYTLHVTRAQIAHTTPTFSVPSSAIAFGTQVALTSDKADAIYYTTDGSEPTIDEQHRYTAPIEVTKAMTVKAIATREHYLPSAVATATYTQAATADLTNVTFSTAVENFTFKPTTYQYPNVMVANNVETLDVATLGTGTIKVTPERLTLKPGVPQDVTITATEQGKSSKTYTMTVTRRLSSDASLTELTVSKGQLSPTFKRDVSAYTVAVNTNETAVSLEAKAATTAKVTYSKQSPLTLQYGANNVAIHVVAEDGVTKKTYNVTIYRDYPPIIVPVEKPATPIVKPNVSREQDKERGAIDAVTVDTPAVKEAITTATTIKQDVKITVPTSEANAVDVKLNEASVKQLAEAKVGVTIEALGGTRLTLAPPTLANLTTDVKFNLTPIKEVAAQKAVADRILAAPEVKQYSAVKVVGEPMKIEANYKNEKTKVMFPLTSVSLPSDNVQRDAFLRKLAIFIEHSDGERKVQMGTVVNDDKGNPVGYEIEISKFSTFTFVTVEAKKEPVVIQGEAKLGATLTVNGATNVVWYRANDSTGTAKQQIATSATYKVTKADELKFISAAVDGQSSEAIGPMKDSAALSYVKVTKPTATYRLVAGKLVKAQTLKANTSVAVYGTVAPTYDLSNGTVTAPNGLFRYEAAPSSLVKAAKQGKSVKFNGQPLLKGQIGLVTALRNATVTTTDGKRLVVKRGIQYRVYGKTAPLWKLANGEYLVK